MGASDLHNSDCKSRICFMHDTDCMFANALYMCHIIDFLCCFGRIRIGDKHKNYWWDCRFNVYISKMFAVYIYGRQISANGDTVSQIYVHVMILNCSKFRWGRHIVLLSNSNLLHLWSSNEQLIFTSTYLFYHVCQVNSVHELKR